MTRAGLVAAGLVAAAPLAACSHARGHGDPDAPPGAADAALDPIDAAVDATDPLPTGAISLFLATGCPTGWAPYDAAAGRTLVPSAMPGVTAGAPLARNEVRAHHHAASVGVDLPSVSYAGVAGAANTGVAAAGHVDGAIATDDGDAALPYVQLLACKKVVAPSAAAVPSGMVSFFDGDACPIGWAASPGSIDGRVMVGLPDGGTPGKTFGGAPLASGETRTHAHPITGTLAVPAHGIALVSGCCAGGYAGAGDRAIGGTSGAAAVELPYLQLRACASP